MRKIIAMIFAMVMGAAVMVPCLAEPVYAERPDPSTAEACDHTFLGLRPWYHGLTAGSDCHVVTPKDPVDSDHLSIPEFVWTIVLNILADLFVVGGLLALGFLIFGGFKYIMSNGDPGKVASAKKTIASAVIGLIIVIMAAVIVNTIIDVLLAARGA